MSSRERRPSGADGSGDRGGDTGGDGVPGLGGRDGQLCPECGTSRASGSAPACGCTERAADAARDARSADAAAAEDFDPLRIRPYVTLPEPGSGEAEAPDPGPGARSVPSPVLPPETEAPVPPRSADVGLFAPGTPTGAAPGSSGLASGPSGLPGPSGSPESSGPEGDQPSPTPPYDDGPEPRRSRRVRLYAGAGAVAAVVAVAVLAAVLLAPDKPQRDQSLPDVPTRAVTAASDSATEPPKSTPAASTSPSAPPSASASSSPSHKESTSPSPSRTASAKPRSTTPPSRSTARATGSVEPSAPKAGGVLRRGDEGPEVVELQKRLQQLYLYMDDADGTYGSEVADAVSRFQYARATQGDGEGVYGKKTRAALEAETREP
ncbi:peptidoglycan-binding protein [Streptomyces sp. NPDC032198]|uniref:peptidoglycan-binding domain-containing protein n=1 Tax=Streptomyces sp. NPDC032198 TaxID=3155127 RepID=UPI0033D580BF